jgi:Squalene-hopene cyclase C-terminal domain/Prenyltransferase and squalene oxidase repeat
MKLTLRQLLAGVLVATGAALPAAAQESPAKQARDLGIAERPNQVAGDELTPKTQAAIEKGLGWLAKRQLKDGSYGGGGMSAQSAITSLAALAMMSSGSLPDRGPYGENVHKAVDYILASAQKSGLLSSDASHGVMYSHGFATLFLAEVYGMSPDERVGEAVTRAVRLIRQSQNEEGGWRYMPIPADADISVTISQVMALRASRDAGIKVDRDMIDKAVDYVRKCQNPDGGFSYMSNRGFGGGGSGFERSAAGVATLYYAGIFEGNDLKRGLDYIVRFQPDRGRANQQFGHYFYGQYYAAQAMFLAGGDYWKNWYPAIREELLRRQRPDGSWSGEVSDEYCTAVALIVLQMPNRYLPVFTGKGPGG